MFILDGITYDVDYTQLEYSATTARKYNYKSADGTEHGEKSGSYRAYTLGIGNRASSLIDTINEHFNDGRSYHYIELYDNGDPEELRGMEIMVDRVTKSIRNIDDIAGSIRYYPLIVEFHTRRPV